MSYVHQLDFKVRDYECDLQGIVNNSVYQNYLEHARHEFLLVRGLDFAEFARAGIYLVVTHVELDYKQPLSSGDAFWVGTNMTRKGKLRFVFQQDVYRQRDGQLMLQGWVTGAAIDRNNKPMVLRELDKLIEA